MNIASLTGCHLRLPLKLHITNILARNTSKIAVEVENEVITRLENNELKPRHHPGIVKGARLQLPQHISRALVRVIGDQPVKKLLNDCKRLNQYINARHPPPEPNEMRTKIRSIAEEVDERLQQKMEGKPAFNSEEELANLQRKRDQAIRKKIGQNIYTWKPITYGAYEALVYAIGRAAHEYAILTNIMREIVARDPHFMPRSYFDFGSGVGTGMWAVCNFWKESIFEFYNVDASGDMNTLSELILRDGKENQQMTLRNVYYRQFLPSLDTKYDLIVCSHSLFELPSAQNRRDVILNLWQKCDGCLIIVEEGTRKGSELVNEARDYILGLNDENLKGHVLAPCPHNFTCPRMAAIQDRTPCNFEISYAPLCVGDMKVDHLTARYSYVVFRKGVSQDSTQSWPRLVRPTLVRSGHAICRMCTAEGKLQEIIFTAAKHGKPAYRCAKASKWGDRLPIAIGEPFETNPKRSRAKKLSNETTYESINKIKD